MKLDKIMDLDLLDEMIVKGYVKVQKHPDDPHWLILNYTDKAVYDRVWNEVTRQCRGLIVTINPFSAEAPFGPGTRVVARPFPKFFNYGEVEAAQIALDEVVDVFDKVDGSLGILYTGPDGRPAIATRGSFASQQALHATEVYRSYYMDEWQPDPAMTYVFEIVYPENRIVLDYGTLDDLVLLGSVALHSGHIERPSTTVFYEGWPGPLAKQFRGGANSPEMTLGDALAIPPRPNAEGLVVRRGTDMVKIKQEDYLALHKIIFGLTEKAVWERLVAGDTPQQICDGLPDEFHPWVSDVSNRLLSEYIAIWRDATAIYRTLGGEYYEKHDRDAKKQFALRVQQSGYKHPGLLYSLRDRKSIAPAVWELIKPEHAPFSLAA